MDMLRCAVTWRLWARFGLLWVFDQWERRRHGHGWEWVVGGDKGVQIQRIGTFFEDVEKVPVYFCQLPKCET